MTKEREMKNWKVVLSDGSATRVDAHYHVIEQGALIFRNSTGSYPEPVAMFAHGKWVEVRKMDEPAYAG